MYSSSLFSIFFFLQSYKMYLFKDYFNYFIKLSNISIWFFPVWKGKKRYFLHQSYNDSLKRILLHKKINGMQN